MTFAAAIALCCIPKVFPLPCITTNPLHAVAPARAAECGMHVHPCIMDK